MTTLPNRAYVILRLSGGLGNQMFQYALGLAMTGWPRKSGRPSRSSWRTQ
ncbi:MAG: hypothetical protein IT440_06390 [Phycisphaeraceae bacterium]|nr:hypothetical protein [Phycisphaeraceae bacterium]